MPSGIAVEFAQTIWDASVGPGTWLRLRFIAPAIGGAAPVPFSALEADPGLI